MAPLIGLAAGAAVAGLIKGSVGEASDLNETLNKSSVIFGKSAREIERFGDTAAKSLGLSKGEAVGFAASFGDMFQQIGFGNKEATKLSKSVVTMSADLGSFNNLETGDVAERISAAFRGEYDSLQTLIPNINAARVEQVALAKTGKKTAKELTAQEKAAAVLAIVHKDGARAAGDFERTSGGLANQQKILSAQTANLKAKVGSALVPVLAKVATYVNSNVIPALYKLPVFFAKIRQYAAPVVAFFRSLIDGSDQSGAKINGLRATLSTAFTAIRSIFQSTVSIVTSLWNLFGSTLVAYATKYITATLTVLRGVLNIIAGVFKIFASLLKGDWSGVWAGIKQVVKGAMQVVRGIITQALNIIKTAFRVLGITILAVVKGAFNGLKSAASAGTGKLVGYVKDLPGKIKSALGNLGHLLYNAGRDLIAGLINGIKSQIGAVGSAMKGIASKIKGFLPGSPIKEGPLTSWNGGGAGRRLVDQGIISGLASRKGAVASAMSDLTSSSLTSSAGLPSGARLASPSGGSAGGSLDGWTRSDIEEALSLLAASRSVQVNRRELAKEVLHVQQRGGRA